MITDNVITAYECLHFMKRSQSKKNGHCALKLDMMKAYDRVEWAYLQAIMLKLGIAESFEHAIMRGVSSVSFTVLLNGRKLQEFQPSRGIRQGDPISPYLFLLAAEGLSCLLRVRSEHPDVRGVVVAPSAPHVNHLLFADDSLLLFKANVSGANQIKDSVQDYCNASGQRVNLQKSSIYFVKGVARVARDEVKQILEVTNESLSKRYLGLPSDVGR